MIVDASARHRDDRRLTRRRISCSDVLARRRRRRRRSSTSRTTRGQVRPGWLFACVVGEHLDGHDVRGRGGRRRRGGAARRATAAARRRPGRRRDVRAVDGPRSRPRSTATRPTAQHGRHHRHERQDDDRVISIAAILRSAGLEPGVTGTLSGVRTTPEATDLQRLLAEYVDEGVEAVVMEVSSHALALHRVAGMRFDVAVFTNLGRDHLDLHESMEAYFRAKASLFTRPSRRRVGVTNIDDPYGRLLLDAAEIHDGAGFALADAEHRGRQPIESPFAWRGQERRGAARRARST